MARGKYAARAANARAETAQESIADLRAQLDAERQENKCVVAGLNAEVQILQGQLVRGVRELAATEIERVRAECLAALAAERAQWRDRAMKLGRILDESVYRLSERESISELLGIPLGELFQQDPSSSTRINRRMTGSKARTLASEIEQARNRGLTFRAKMAGALPDAVMDVVEDQARAAVCESAAEGGAHGAR